MNTDEILFRCSSLGHLFVEPKSKADKEAGNLSESTKKHLVDVYVSNRYNRFTEISGKALDKGNDTEEDSITTVSRLTKTFLTKNTEALSNTFIRGTPDLFIGPSIKNATIVRDTKSSWDIYTFHRAKYSPLNPMYKWQLVGYMWLTGAQTGFVDYCLNNTPWYIVENELRKESYNHPMNDTPDWIELQIIANHTYDKKTFTEYINLRGIYPTDENSNAVVLGFVEVPLCDRHFCFEIKRDESEIELLKEKIIKSRNYINGFLS